VREKRGLDNCPGPLTMPSGYYQSGSGQLILHTRKIFSTKISGSEARLPLPQKIVAAVIAEAKVPVTAKIRTGWNEDSVNYQEVGLLLQEG
jgi:hypothetical protein